jgi:hypothetical protein
MDEYSEPLIIRRDMVGQICLACPFGTYVKTCLVDDVGRIVECNECHMQTHRWKTKSEYLALAQRVGEE